MMDGEAQLESLLIEWIIQQVRSRRQMKDTLPIEGAMTIPLEWAESLINFYDRSRLVMNVTASQWEGDRQRDALAAIVARCMEWTEHLPISRGGVVRTDAIMRFVEELRGIAGQALAPVATGDAM